VQHIITMSMFSLRISFFDGAYCRVVNQLMMSTYTGGMVQLGIALWAVGNCISQYDSADYRYGLARCR
jgi:hypothetical protein